MLSILDELAPVFEVLSPEGGWERTTLATLPKLGVVAVWPLDQEEIEQDGTLLVNAQDPLTPPTLLLLDESLAQPTVLRQAPRAFSAPEAVVSRHEAFSTDGERIPYVQVGPAGLTGDAPVHLTGYGGFRIRELALLSRYCWQAVARARRHDSGRQHSRRRRVRHALARGRTSRRKSFDA